MRIAPVVSTNRQKAMSMPLMEEYSWVPRHSSERGTGDSNEINFLRNVGLVSNGKGSGGILSPR